MSRKRSKSKAKHSYGSSHNEFLSYATADNRRPSKPDTHHYDSSSAFPHIKAIIQSHRQASARKMDSIKLKSPKNKKKGKKSPLPEKVDLKDQDSNQQSHTPNKLTPKPSVYPINPNFDENEPNRKKSPIRKSGKLHSSHRSLRPERTPPKSSKLRSSHKQGHFVTLSSKKEIEVKIDTSVKRRKQLSNRKVGSSPSADDAEKVDLYSQLTLDFENYKKCTLDFQEDLQLLKIQFINSLPYGNRLVESRGTMVQSDVSKFEKNQEKIDTNNLVIQNLRRERAILKRVLEKRRAEELELAEKKAGNGARSRSRRPRVSKYKNQKQTREVEVGDSGKSFEEILFVNEPKSGFVSPYMSVINGQTLSLRLNLKNEHDHPHKAKNSYYTFDSVVKSFDLRIYEELVKTQIEHLCENIDYLCCLYGANRTGKEELASNILYNFFSVYKERFLKGSINEFVMKINSVCYDKKARWSEILLKPHKYDQQIDELYESLVVPEEPNTILLKDKIEVEPLKFIFIELSKIREHDFKHDSELLAESSDKISGISIIMYNKKLPSDVIRSGKDPIKQILLSAKSYFKGTNMTKYIENLLSRFEVIKKTMILTVDPQSLAERSTKAFVKSVKKVIKKSSPGRKGKKGESSWKL